MRKPDVLAITIKEETGKYELRIWAYRALSEREIALAYQDWQRKYPNASGIYDFVTVLGANE